MKPVLHCAVSNYTLDSVLHYTPLHSTTLHYTPLHSTTLVQYHRLVYYNVVDCVLEDKVVDCVLDDNIVDCILDHNVLVCTVKNDVVDRVSEECCIEPCREGS